MAYSAPSTRSTSDLITASIWNADVVANPIAIYAGAMSVSSQAVGDILYASSTTQLGRIAAVATGQVLTSAGTGTVPAWSSNVDLGGTLDVTGATTLDSTLGVVGAGTFNDAGADVDFRVESDDNQNMLFVDGGEDRVGIGTGSPQQTLHIERTNGPHLLLSRISTGISFTDGTTLGHIEIGGQDADSTYDGDAAQIIGQASGAWTSSSHPTEILFTTTAASSTSASTRLTIESDGTVTIPADLVIDTDTLFVDASEDKVYIGHTASVGTGPALQIASTGGAAASLCVSRWSNDAGSGNLLLMKSRAATVGGSAVIVADDDPLGAIQWQADDGTDQATSAASIITYVDGTPGSNDMPARMVFATCADGAASPPPAMTIDSIGDIYSNVDNETYNRGWYNYINDSTVVGFSSYTASRYFIMIKTLGQTCFVNYYIEGVSDSTVTTFTVPYTAISYGTAFGFHTAMGFTYDNSSYKTPGRCNLSHNDNVVYLWMTYPGGTTWTASGSKIVGGQFFYQMA